MARQPSKTKRPKVTIEKMDDFQLVTQVGDLLDDAIQYTDDFIRPERLRAIKSADGKMDHLKSEEGRSSIVSHDEMAAITKSKPSIHRTILGSKIAEYKPGGANDEEEAKQASDYFNEIIVPETDLDIAIENAVDDALRMGNGVLKWWYEERKSIRANDYTGLGDQQFEELTVDRDVKIPEHTQREELIQDGEGNELVITVHDARIIETITKDSIRVMAVPPEEIIKHPETNTMTDSPLIAHHSQDTRSELVAIGHDIDTIYDLPRASLRDADTEKDERERIVHLKRETTTNEDLQNNVPKELEKVDIYECYVHIDFDGDGIAELRRVVLAGDRGQYELLENDYFNEIPLCDVIAKRQAHQWLGESVHDQIGDIQELKTVLLRQTIDNLYWQNNLQPIVEEASIINLNAVSHPQFGEPIRVRKGAGKDALRYNIVPFVAEKSFNMLAYMDKDIEDRTGISQAAAGLEALDLQNVTAAATNMIERASTAQAEMIVKEVARSITPMLSGVLKLIVQHQDRPRTVRLRNKWVEIDPRAWNAEMDANVNIGLGAGTREKDMAAISLILNMQRELLTEFGPINNPYVKHDQLYNSLAEMTAATGIKTVERFFTEPTKEDIQRIEQQQQQKDAQPDPQVLKVQAQIALDKQKAEADIELDRLKAVGQGLIAKEKQDADIALINQTAQHKIQMETTEKERVHDLDHAKIAQSGETARLDVQLQHDRKVMQIRAELNLKAEQIDEELILSADKADAELAIKGSISNGGITDVNIGGEPG